MLNKTVINNNQSNIDLHNRGGINNNQKANVNTGTNRSVPNNTINNKLPGGLTQKTGTNRSQSASVPQQYNQQRP